MPTRRHLNRKTHKAEPRNGEQQEIINISRDRLALTLNDHFRRLKRAHGWPTPLAITLSLWVVIPVSDFKNTGGLQANQWQLLVVFAAITTTLWTIFWCMRAQGQAVSEESLLDAICARSDILTDSRGIFYLKNRGEDNAHRVLVYFDVSWGCYLLPHADIQALDTADLSLDGALVSYAARNLGAEPEHILLHPVPAATLQSRKFSEFYKRDKQYTFKFFHVIVKDTSALSISEPQFDMGGRRFRWMTTGEMLAHQDTARRNADVIRHLESMHVELFSGVPDSLLKEQ